jgi:hypothetical protein
MTKAGKMGTSGRMPGRTAGFVSLEVSTGQEGDLTRRGLQLEFVDPARVDMVYPSQGVMAGGSMVTVTGAGFKHGTTACAFGDVMVKAEVISRGEARCVMPASPIGMMTFEMSTVYDEREDTRSAISGYGFRFHSTGGQNLMSTDPVFVEAAGGSVVRATVLGAHSGDDVACLFGGIVTVKAEVESDGIVKCQTASAIEGNTTMRVATNGQDWSNHAWLVYSPVANVTLVLPKHVQHLGGATASVSLANMPNYPVFCGVGGASMSELPWAYSTTTMHYSKIAPMAQARCMLPGRGMGYRVVEVSASAGGELTRSGVQVS